MITHAYTSTLAYRANCTPIKTTMTTNAHYIIDMSAHVGRYANHNSTFTGIVAIGMDRDSQSVRSCSRNSAIHVTDPAVKL